jgi:hypothetical protein
MAFSISISSDLRAVIAELVAPWRCPDIYAPSSGALTIERIVRAHSKARVHGASPDLIAAAAGSYFAKLPFRVALQPQAAERLDFIAPALEEQRSALAAALVVAQFAKALSRDNVFYRRYVEGLRLQWPTLHAKALAKLAADPLTLDSYVLAGVAELLGLLDDDAGVITHAGMWRRDLTREALLASIFDWDAPEVADLTKKEDRDQAIGQITQRDHWILVTNEERADLDYALRSRVQVSARGVASYVYAASGPQRLVRPRQKLAPLLAPRLSAGQELQGELSLALLPTDQFNSLRAAHLASGIRPGAVTSGLAAQNVAVLVGGVIIGAYALSFDPTLCTIADGKLPAPTVYLLSDFAVGPTDYPRLSKLVVMAALSTEAKLLAERKLAQRWRSLVTTAFSQNPVSMKYRGLVELISRAEAQGADFAGGKGYKLTYGGPFGGWSLAEALTTWQAKHGERRATQ